MLSGHPLPKKRVQTSGRFPPTTQIPKSSQTTITNSSTLTQSSDASTCWNGNSGACNSGALYAYRRTGEKWAQEAYIKAANAERGDYFGSALAVFGDTLAVGAPYEDSNQTTITNGSTFSQAIDFNNCNSSACDSGAVYAFRRSHNAWSQEGILKASNAGRDDFLGHKVAMSGNAIAVSSVNEMSKQTKITNGSTASADDSYYNVGTVYVFRNSARVFDPDIRESGISSNAITFAWGEDLGKATHVIVAPVQEGTSEPNVGCAGGTTLPTGTTSYTYSGLSAETKYEFLFCASHGIEENSGALIWDDTLL